MELFDSGVFIGNFEHIFYFFQVFLSVNKSFKQVNESEQVFTCWAIMLGYMLDS